MGCGRNWGIHDFSRDPIRWFKLKFKSPKKNTVYK